jgi:hypothetical protein
MKQSGRMRGALISPLPRCICVLWFRYVNEIASIVHSHVSLLDGHPNKNVGDAFLVVWRLKRRQHKHGTCTRADADAAAAAGAGAALESGRRALALLRHWVSRLFFSSHLCLLVFAIPLCISSSFLQPSTLIWTLMICSS